VLASYYGSIATATEAVRLGAISYLAKPADIEEILKAFFNNSLQQEGPSEEILPPSLARVEWEHIQRVLADSDDNISCAAKKKPGFHRKVDP